MKRIETDKHSKNNNKTIAGNVKRVIIANSNKSKSKRSPKKCGGCSRIRKK